MCHRYQHHDDTPEWIRSAQSLAREHHAVVVQAACVVLVLAAITGTLFYLFTPTDIGRAEADLKRAHEVVNALDKEASVRQEAAQAHHSQAAECRRCLENGSATAADWAERNRALADSRTQLCRANLERRDILIHLTAVYLRLLAEAECEILRAKDARDRGTPYKVAPRVGEILAPILSAN